MSSRGKKKTTMAKLARESRLRERRLEKEHRKQARREGLLVEEPVETVPPHAPPVAQDDDAPVSSSPPA